MLVATQQSAIINKLAISRNLAKAFDIPFGKVQYSSSKAKCPRTLVLLHKIAQYLPKPAVKKFASWFSGFKFTEQFKKKAFRYKLIHSIFTRFGRDFAKLVNSPDHGLQDEALDEIKQSKGFSEFFENVHHHVNYSFEKNLKPLLKKYFEKKEKVLNRVGIERPISFSFKNIEDGFKSAMRTIIGLAKLITDVYQREFNHEIDAETFKLLFNRSKKIAKELANLHIVVMRYVFDALRPSTSPNHRDSNFDIDVNFRKFYHRYFEFDKDPHAGGQVIPAAAFYERIVQSRIFGRSAPADGERRAQISIRDSLEKIKLADGDATVPHITYGCPALHVKIPVSDVDGKVKNISLIDLLYKWLDEIFAAAWVS